MTEYLFGLGGADLALAIPRVATGLFFAISGGHKLLVKQRHDSLVQTLTSDHVPAVGFMQWWVPACEFAGGLLLAVGLASVPAAAVLAILMVVACCCEANKRVEEYKPMDRLDRLDDYLYLPEVLYLLLLSVTLLSGPGAYSVDKLLWG